MKAQGIFKRVVYKEEATWGELPGSSGGKELRRITGDFNLTKETYSSEEINQRRQVSDLRHGVRQTDGTLSGEMSPGSYSDFIGAVLGNPFAVSAASTTGAEVTIAASGTNFTITRTAGSYITDGFQVGMVVRLTGAGLDAANVGNNLLIVSVTALVLTVQVLSSTALVAEGPISAVDVAPVGKVSFIPETGHVVPSYTIEQWYSDIAQSEVFTGLKVGSWDVSLPATGLVTADFSFMGKDLTQTGNSAYFTSPAPASTTGLLAAVQGAVLVNGSTAACITDASISVNAAQEPAQCLGSNYVSEIFTGRIEVTGSLSAYFSDGTMRDYFNSESEVTIVIAMTTSEAKDADVISIVMPRVKLNSASVADAELGLVQSIDFQALYNDDDTTGLVKSTIMVQDSAA